MKRKKKTRNTFYFGKYRTPIKLSAVANEQCYDSEMNVSYFETCLNKYRGMVSNGDFTSVVRGLVNFIIEDPAEDVDPKCTPPPLPDIKCEDHKSVFGNNVKRVEDEKQQPKIAILIQLGFDVDMLEVYLWEVYDVVDKFFITESIVSHSNRQIRKPLIWELVRDKPRFKRFQDKVVHFILDEADREVPNGNVWLSEYNQEKLRWEKFKEWNSKTQYFKDTDIIGFGDTDEIPSRNALAVLKQCTGNLTHVDIGTTFLWGNYDVAFRSDWPVPSHPYSYGDPTFFTLKDALAYTRGKDYPNRMRGQSGRYILGGAHITPYPYLPFLLNKYMVATEYGRLSIINGNLEDIERHYINDVKRPYISRVRNATKVMDQIKSHYYIPWIMNCTPERYRPFYRKTDPRIYYPPCFFHFEC